MKVFTLLFFLLSSNLYGQISINYKGVEVTIFNLLNNSNILEGQKVVLKNNSNETIFCPSLKIKNEYKLMCSSTFVNDTLFTSIGIRDLFTGISYERETYLIPIKPMQSIEIEISLVSNMFSGTRKINHQLSQKILIDFLVLTELTKKQLNDYKKQNYILISTEQYCKQVSFYIAKKDK